MSYILDALKKAESERERGVVPGLNSAQANHATIIHYGSDQKPWWILALVLGLLLVGVIALWGWRQSAAGSATALTPPAAPLSPAAAAPPPPPLAPAQVLPQPALPSLVAVTPTAPLPKPELPVRAQAPAAVAAPASALQPAASTVAHVQAKAAPAPAGPALPAAPPAPVEAGSKPAPVSAPVRSASGGVPMLSELPEPMRRQIPALNISGAVYSDSPPEWTLIINDQLIGKGGQVAADVRLEEVSASSAVFNFKGQRFRMER